MAIHSACRLLILIQAIFSIVPQAVAVVHIGGVSGGVNTETGERPARQDIRNLQSSGPPFDLYLLSLKQFQEDGRYDPLGYHQVSAIHGLPFGSWDGVQGTEQNGYCSHGSTLFPLWHRPYLALYEQMIWNKAQEIAASYPKSERPKYVSAAKKLRIPFWDWASNPSMPESVITPQIDVNTPSGPQTIRNPLYNYAINPTDEDGFPKNDVLSSFQTTVRSPDQQGRTQIEESQKRLRASGSTLRINTYELLTGETNYTVFSTHSLQDRGENYNNLEALHNNIHPGVGGHAGHMTYTPWSAFDPIFWLHHANVDRVFALWQALYPDSYNVRPLPNQSGDFVKKPGTVEDANTPLTPFRISDNEYYTSKTARFIRDLGYSYPEIQDWKFGEDELAKQVRRKVNELYNGPGGGTRAQKRAHSHYHGAVQEKRASLPLDLEGGLEDLLSRVGAVVEILGNLGETSLEHFEELGINNMEKQWVINVKVDKSAHPSPFGIHFFMGPPPADPATWPSASNLIGTFATNGHTRYTIHNQIPLSHALATLLSKSIIGSIGEDIVVPLLTELLEWRILTLDGEVVDIDELAGGDDGVLEIKIASRDVETLQMDGDDDEELSRFPGFGEWKVFESVTKGKVGGYSGSY